jgi:predicted transcriptional regulator
MTETLSIRIDAETKRRLDALSKRAKDCNVAGVVPRLNQTTHGHASLAATSGRNPDKKALKK